MERSISELINEIKIRLEQKDGEQLLHELKELINSKTPLHVNVSKNNIDTNDNVSDSENHDANDSNNENCSDSENHDDTENNTDVEDSPLNIIFPNFDDSSNMEDEGEGDERHYECEQEEANIRKQYNILLDEMKFTNIDQLNKAIDQCLVTDIYEDTELNNYSIEVKIGNFYFEIICPGSDPIILKSESEEFKMQFSSDSTNFILESDFETLANLLYNDLNKNGKDNQETFTTALKSIINRIFYKIIINKSI